MEAKNRKIKDSDFDVSTGSRADRYWKQHGFRLLYKKFRTPELQPAPGDPYEFIKEKFGIHAIEFGNWVPIDSRFNYLIATIVALHDIRLAIGFPDVGFNKLSLAFGARGASRALAHYEPTTDAINMTRYRREDGKELFNKSGGVGALAHEYGHFLDYFYGVRVKNKSGSRALSGGQRTATRFTQEELKDKGLWGMMSRVLEKIIWNGKAHTAYYERVQKKGMGDYWYRRNELFARAFEQYVQYKLSKRGITNAFLTGGHKYDRMGDVYMRSNEFSRVIPLMDKLIAGMRKIKVSSKK